MLDYINWYVVELKFRLASYVPADRLEIITSEAIDHLRHSANARMELEGISEDAATLKAIEVFGTPDSVARGYLREAEPQVMGMRPIWVVLLGAFLATASWDYMWTSMHGFFDNFGDTWELGPAFLACLFGLYLVGLGCRNGFRSFRVPLLAFSGAMALASVVVLSIWMVSVDGEWQGISRFHLSRDVANVKHTLANLDRMSSYVERGSVAFATAKSASDVPAEFIDPQIAEREVGMEPGHIAHFFEDSFGSQGAVNALDRNPYVVPGGCFAMVDGRISGLQSTSGFETAQKDWKTGKTHQLESIQIEKGRLTAILGAALEAQSGRIFFFNPDVYKETAIQTLFFAPILLLVDSFVLLAFWRRASRSCRVLATM